MLPSITASRSGHWNQDGSRRWQRAIRPSPSSPQPRPARRRENPRRSPALRAAAAGSVDADRAGGQRGEDLLDQREALLDLANADPDARVDIASVEHRHIEAERVVGRIGRSGGRRSSGRRRVRHSRPRANCRGKRGRSDAGSDGAVLQRGGAVIEVDQRAERPRGRRRPAPRQLGCRIGREIGGDAAGNDRIHHQPMAERGRRAAAPARAARRNGHASARRRRRCRSRRCRRNGWRGVRARPSARAATRPAAAASTPSAASAARAKAERIGDSASRRMCVRRGCAPWSRSAPCHQAFDALVDIAKPLLQPHDCFAVGGEAKMARLDDAGMHRADRDLVQAFAFGGKEGDREARLALAARSRRPAGGDCRTSLSRAPPAALRADLPGGEAAMAQPQRPWSSHGRLSARPSAPDRRGRGSPVRAGSPAGDRAPTEG